MTDPLNKTLIVRFSSIGDVVLSSLLVRTFRTRFPDSRIDFVVKQEYADLVRFNPCISSVIEFPKNGTFADLRGLRREIKARNYDLIIDIHDSLRSRFLCTGARHVVRINKRKFARFLLVKFKMNVYDKSGGAPGVAKRYIEPVGDLGVKDDGRGLDLFFSDNDELKVSTLVRESGLIPPFIGIAPSARHANKRWLKGRFAETAATLARDHNSPLVLFGSDLEHGVCTEIQTLILRQNPGAAILNLAGRISLTETAAMMHRCSLVISNDSGLMHIAAAGKCKIVAIFGPTVKEFGFFPFGTDSIVVEENGLYCRPCTHIGLPACPEGHFKCMNDISAARVIDASRDLLRTIPQ